MADDPNFRRGAPLAPGSRIFLCDTTHSDRYERGVRRFLDLIGIGAALVTDESSVGDFALGRDLQPLIEALGRPVRPSELVWIIAAELEALEKSPPTH